MIRILATLVPPSARPLRRRYEALLVASVVGRAGACVLLVPLLARLFSADPGDAWPWIALFAAVVVLSGVLQRRLARTGFELGLATLEHTSRHVAERVGALPLGWFSGGRRTTAQQVLATTGPPVAQAIGNLVTPFVTALALPAAIGVGLLFVAWPLGLAALVAVPLLLLAHLGAAASSKRADAAFDASVAELDDRVLEFGRAQRTLRAARRADPERSLAGEALDRHQVATVGLLRWSVPGQVLFSVALQVSLLVLAVTAVALLRRGEVTPAEAVALLVVAVRFLEPFTALSELTPAIQATTGTLRRIDTVLAAPALSGGSPAGAADLRSPPEVRLDGVTFRYPGAREVTLDGVDLVAPAGSTTAIVGPSGAGKSTLLALIARFHDADAGQVLIGGHDVREHDSGDLYSRLAMIFQDVYLFDGTIRDNVAAGRPGAVDDELAAAAAMSRVDEIVARLPGGWDTPVGEGGAALSSGERQRVGIARALLKGAPLLLVDEATSSLDTDNESVVAAALSARDGTRTTIVVAHRMATITAADHVVFLDRGRVVEAGGRAELLAANGRFAAFHRDQLDSLEWTVGGRGQHPPAPSRHPWDVARRSHEAR